MSIQELLGLYDTYIKNNPKYKTLETEFILCSHLLKDKQDNDKEVLTDDFIELYDKIHDFLKNPHTVIAFNNTVISKLIKLTCKQFINEKNQLKFNLICYFFINRGEFMEAEEEEERAAEAEREFRKKNKSHKRTLR